MELILLKVKTVKNVEFATIGILIMDLKFKNLFIAFAMICWRFALILAILVLSLLKVLLHSVIVVHSWQKQIWFNLFIRKFSAWWLWMYKKYISKKSILKIVSRTIIWIFNQSKTAGILLK